MSYEALRRGRHSQSGQEYLVTTVIAKRAPIFMDFALARKAIDALRSAETAREARWLAWVLMPDHFHGLLSFGEQGNLASTVGRFKGTSARAINLHLKSRGPVWQSNYHDHALRAEEDRQNVARYIVANPLRAGLVEHIGEWPHWDSVWL